VSVTGTSSSSRVVQLFSATDEQHVLEPLMRAFEALDIKPELTVMTCGPTGMVAVPQLVDPIELCEQLAARMCAAVRRAVRATLPEAIVCSPMCAPLAPPHPRTLVVVDGDEWSPQAVRDWLAAGAARVAAWREEIKTSQSATAKRARALQFTLEDR
jgi:hypothetical protein